MHPPSHPLLDAHFLSSLRLTFADEHVGRSIPLCIIIYIPLSTIARSTVVQYRFCTTHDDALCLVLGSCYLCIWSFSYPPHHTLCHCRSFLRTFINPLTSPLLWLYPFIFHFSFAKQSLTLDDKRVPVGSHPFFIYPRIYTYHHFSLSSLSASRTNKSFCFVDASCCGVDVSFIVRSFFFSASSLTTPCCCCFDAKMYYSIYIPFFCCSHFISAISFFSFTHSSLILSRSCFINLHLVTCTLLIIICFLFLG